MTRALLTALLAALALSACGGEPPLGGGLDVGLCDAQAELDALPEPRPTVRAEVVRYADGVLRVVDRVDLRLDAGGKVDRREAQRELEVLRTAMRRYRAEVRAAMTGPDLTRAFVRLADGAYDRASQRLGVLARRGCS